MFSIMLTATKQARIAAQISARLIVAELFIFGSPVVWVQVAGADLRHGCEVSSSTEPASLSPPAPRLCARDAAHQPAHSPASRRTLAGFEPASLGVVYRVLLDAPWIYRQRERLMQEARANLSLV